MNSTRILQLRGQRILGLLLTSTLAACGGDDASLSPASLPLGQVGEPYEAAITANDFDEGPSWSLVQGDLPPGLEGAADGSRWVITGTPVTPGSFQFIVRADGGEDRIDRLYRIVISGGEEPLVITTPELPLGTVGLAYQALLSAAGGTGRGFEWTQTGLPDELTLARAGATIAQVTGVPTSAGEREVIFRVTDDAMNTATATLTLTIQTEAASLEITSEALPGAVRGLPYEAQITANGGSGAGYTWTASELPEGITLQSGTPSATLSGTPTQDEAGQVAVQFTVTDSEGATAERSYAFSVKDPDDLVISPKRFDDGALGEPYSEALNAVGGVGPFAWSLSAGTPPAGLDIVASTTRATTFEGTPTAAGAFTFTIQITDALGAEATLPVELFVQPAPLEIIDAAPPTGNAGAAYTATLEATGGAAPFAWSIVAGALPPGLSLQPSTTDTVVVSGTPTQGGTFDVTIEVEDDLGTTDEQAFTFVIDGALTPLEITTAAVADATVGQAYIQDLVASGGTGIDYEWRVVLGALPAGLELEEAGTPATRLLGVPTESGTFDFTVEVTDSAGSFDQVTYTLTSTVVN